MKQEDQHGSGSSNNNNNNNSSKNKDKANDTLALRRSASLTSTSSNHGPDNKNKKNHPPMFRKSSSSIHHKSNSNRRKVLARGLFWILFVVAPLFWIARTALGLTEQQQLLNSLLYYENDDTGNESSSSASLTTALGAIDGEKKNGNANHGADITSSESLSTKSNDKVDDKALLTVQNQASDSEKTSPEVIQQQQQTSSNNKNNNVDSNKPKAKKPKFDYKGFWEQAWQVALLNNQSLNANGHWRKIQSGRGGALEPNKDDTDAIRTTQNCPKVYVYNLSSFFQDVSWANITSVDHVFGARDVDAEAATGVDWRGTLRLTHQYAGGEILEHRLRAPGNCYQTSNPDEADLFFVPIFTAAKKSQEWKAACKSFNVTADLLPQLTYLTNQTACQHFFIFGKGHLPSYHCKDWFYTPLPLLRNSMRLAYSHDNHSLRLLRYDRYGLTPEQMRPNLVSIPYPSSLHWSHQVLEQNENENNNNKPFIIPWQIPNSQRKVLMSYVGRFDHGDLPVRSRIKRQCKSYQNPQICSYPTERTKRKAVLPSLQILVKQDSKFCLEPEGDTPWRKSVSDSITFGCIPVLFSDRTDDVAPLHWRHWKQQGRVLIDRDDYMSGRVDLRKLLSSIPKKLLELMQLTIRHFARQFQFSLEEDAPVDGIHAIIEGLKEQMLDRKLRKGECGPPIT